MNTLRFWGLTLIASLIFQSSCKKAEELHPLVEMTIGTRDFHYTGSELGFIYDSLGNVIDYDYIPMAPVTASAKYYQQPDAVDGLLLDNLLKIELDSIVAKVDGDTLRISSQIAGFSSGGNNTIQGKLYMKADSLIIEYSWFKPGWDPEPNGGGFARGSAKQ